MSKALVILSGGMDSSILLHHVTKKLNYDEVYAITYNYGQRIIREIDCARYQVDICNVKEHKIIDMDFFRDISTMSALTNINLSIPKARDDIGNAQPLSYVPFRNLLLLTTAAGWAESVGATELFYGAVQTDDFSGYWDCTSLFLNKVNEIYGLNRKNVIKVNAPFMQYSKEQVVAEGIELGVNFKQTHTCYEGKEIACGECVSCSARLKAFIDNKIIDPISYAKEIPWARFECKPYTKSTYVRNIGQ
jgi:7-cyano-7-deazaguanine synthase